MILSFPVCFRLTAGIHTLFYDTSGFISKSLALWG